MKRPILIIAILLSGILLGFGLCLIYENSKSKSSNNDEYFLCWETLDSISTEFQLDMVIDGEYMYPDKRYFRLLERRSDLRYLPYFIQMYQERYLPKDVAGFNRSCFAGISNKYDSTLFNLYIYLTDNENQKNSTSDDDWFEDESQFDSSKKYQNYELIDGDSLSVDSLRVRVVAHNDRSALEKLETYYAQRNEPKELAIYYKVMLNYEGNGDLAEKFYYVLRPCIDEEHQYMNGIRSVLLRAALCDHNERAQELCDSLGFSLCDYRLPLPQADIAE